jgi:hypothetical protein
MIFIEDWRGIKALDDFLLDEPTISQEEREQIMEIIELKNKKLKGGKE